MQASAFCELVGNGIIPPSFDCPSNLPQSAFEKQSGAAFGAYYPPPPGELSLLGANLPVIGMPNLIVGPGPRAGPRFIVGDFGCHST